LAHSSLKLLIKLVLLQSHRDRLVFIETEIEFPVTKFEKLEMVREMLSLSIGFLVMSALNSFEILAHIPTDSVDYWIGNISPQCAINIIYFERTNDFIFNSVYTIPVLFVPLIFYQESEEFENYLGNHQFKNISLRFMKAECYFSILYYKLLNDDSDDSNIFNQLYYLVTEIAYGFPDNNEFDSNSTYCLILYHRSKRNDEKKFYGLMLSRMEMNLALVYLSNSSKRRYNVYCKTPSMKFQVAARNVVDKVVSIVDQKFMVTCSSQYTFVAINEHNTLRVYDPERFVYERKIITSMLLKANISIFKGPKLRSIPRVILSDIDYFIRPLLYFPTFDDSIRFFTCYTLPAYVSAFELQVWIAIILSGILIATFLKGHIYYNLSKTLNFSTLLFYFSIFMEEAYSIPSTIRNNKVYRTASILWLLTAIVLTNIYISHVISGLNAPLAGEKLKNNDLYGNLSKEPETDLIYFSKPGWLQDDLQTEPYLYFHHKLVLEDFLENLHRDQASTVGFTILSEPKSLSYPEDAYLHIRNPFIYSFYHNSLLQIQMCTADIFRLQSSLCLTSLGLMKLTNKYYPDTHNFKLPWNYSNYPTGAVEEELVKCQKSVYAEQSNQLEFKYMSESYRMKRFYYLEDRFASMKQKWSFFNLQKSKLPFYFNMFL